MIVFINSYKPDKRKLLELEKQFSFVLDLVLNVLKFSIRLTVIVSYVWTMEQFMFFFVIVLFGTTVSVLEWALEQWLKYFQSFSVL